jgi:hypothetical protein
MGFIPTRPRNFRLNLTLSGALGLYELGTFVVGFPRRLDMFKGADAPVRQDMGCTPALRADDE